MNGKELLDKMSEVDPKLIEEADKVSEKAEEDKPKKKRALFIGIGSGMAAVAAALAIFVTLGGGFNHKPSVEMNNSAAGADALQSTPTNGVEGGSTSTDKATNESDIDSGGTTGILKIDSLIKPEAVAEDAFASFDDLPLISNKDYGVRGGANMAVGLYSVYEGGEPDTLETVSPWSLDAELSTLPVFLSNSTEPDVDQMRERVINAAAILGIPESKLEIKANGAEVVGGIDGYREYMEKEGIPQDEIDREIDRLTRSVAAQTSIEGISSSVTIIAHTDGSLWFYFQEPYPELPEGYNLDLHNPDPEVLAATFEYLAEEYKELFDYQNPKVARYEDIFEYEYRVYEGEGDLDTQIVNYWLNQGEFLPNWDNPREMDMLRIHTSDNLEKLGDYPIYTAQQALWVMQSDRVPEEVRIPEGAEVVRVELEYSNSMGYTAVIPYYVFTVKTDEPSQFTDGLVYKYYRIPAVPEQFLDMTIEDYGVRA